ncbi:hypothetical protein SpAn4DRAFT_2067 [Sporomusa ovata]|uniref:Uncharacterized protein n=1 Tax=Sporomusa ovata TaxID=2378 RepID=A0A0U1KVD1_9FIRM|nr:hypothetical protein SpAn4DRAFT_2067 [Sporomusa ovata]
MLYPSNRCRLRREPIKATVGAVRWYIDNAPPLALDFRFCQHTIRRLQSFNALYKEYIFQFICLIKENYLLTAKCGKIFVCY